MASNNKITLRDLSRIAIFAAIIAALTLVAIPQGAGVPITLQTLGVMLAGIVLGAYRGALAVTLYIFLGLLGLPIFAGHAAGFAVLVSPTAGFLLGFIPGAFVVGLIARTAVGKFSIVRTTLAAIFGGVGVVYAFGILGLMVNAKLGLVNATVIAISFVPIDLVKAAIAVAIAFGLYRAYPKAFKN